MIKHICAKNGCNKVIDISDKYCELHITNSNDRQNEYDKNIRYKRDKQYHSFYTSYLWVKTRDYINTKYNYLSLWELIYENKIVPAEEIHHIEPIKDNWNRRLDTSNLIPLSHKAHMYVESEYKDNKSGMQEKLFILLRIYEEKFR